MADETENKAKVEFEAAVNEQSFQNAEKRAQQSVNNIAESTRQSTREIEREARNQARVAETNQQEETAILRAQQRERDRIRREAASIAKSQLSEESRAYADKINREKAQDREAAAIRKAMHQDEMRRIQELRVAESQYAADRRRFDRERRERQLYTPGQIAAFRQGADRLLEELGGGGGGNGPGGPPRRGRGWGGGQGIDPFLTSFGFGLGATGAPGSRLLGTVALGQGFGGREGLYGGLAGGAVAIAAVVAIKAIKDAMAETSAEQKFSASILQIGTSYDKARGSAESFRSVLAVSRAESLAIASAFAEVGTKVETRPGDISAITARANASGQSPEELAKTLQAIARGSKEAFEEQTGLKATIVINEYARSIGLVPAQLAKAQEAQALYNKFVLQGANFQELAAARLNSAEGRWAKFKASVTDFSAEFGQALYNTYIRGETISLVAEREWKETLALDRAQAQPNIRAQLEEQKRQRELDLRYESAAKLGEYGLKERQRERPGETAAERLKELIRFRQEFDILTAGLDAADPRIKSVSESIEQQFSQAVGRAYNEVEQLRKSTRGMTGEFAALQLPAQNNPFVKLYSDAAEAADRAYDRFRVLGDETVDQFARMQRAAIDAQIFQVQIQTSMKATSLEFEAARLSKPFIELTGEMKRSLSVLQTEVGAAINVPKLLAQATAIDLYSRFQTPRANERAFGLFGVSETSDTFVSQQQFDRILKLRRQYAGEGLGGREAQHILDLELIKLYSSLPPGLQAQALRAPGSRGPGGFANVFQGALRGEAGYANEQIDLAVQRAVIGRQAAVEAQAKLRELQRLGADPKAQRGALRAEILAITGALPREELTPDLLKGRIDALREEAVFQRQSQEAAVQAVAEAQALKRMLDERLQSIEDSIKKREESVLLRVLDDSGRTRISTLGPAMGSESQGSR